MSDNPDDDVALPPPLALWFGPDDQRIFGWLHHPGTESARAAVVICPSIGLEAGFSHFLLRQVASRLASLGFLVIRMDYPGTGDSADVVAHRAVVPEWISSVGEAADLARTFTDGPLVLLGMRIGGLLAVESAQARADVDGLVLWDSPDSGKRYLRELLMRQQVAVGEVEDDAGQVTSMGITLSAATSHDLSLLSMHTHPRLPCARALLLQRPGRTSRTALLTRQGARPFVVEAADQDDLLLAQRLPASSEDALISWFDQTYVAQHSVSPAPGLPAQELEMAQCTETVLRLGPHGLFGIMTEPRVRASEAVVVLVPDAHTPHSGLSRMWTDLARTWASAGVRTLRFDVSGCADSEPRPGEAGHRVGLLHHIDDLVDIVHSVQPDGAGDVVLVGICSAAYLVLEASYEVTPAAVAVINPAFAFMTPEFPASARRRVRQTSRPLFEKPFGRLLGLVARSLSPVLRYDDPDFDWSRWFESTYWQNSLTRRLARLPEAFWWLLNRILLRRRPDEVLQEIAERGIRVLLVAGDPDHAATTKGARRVFHRLSRAGSVEEVHLPRLDHSVLGSGQKERVSNLLTDYVGRVLGLPGRASTSASD